MVMVRNFPKNNNLLFFGKKRIMIFFNELGSSQEVDRYAGKISSIKAVRNLTCRNA
jgi:hypothetical protein